MESRVAWLVTNGAPLSTEICHHPFPDPHLQKRLQNPLNNACLNTPSSSLMGGPRREGGCTAHRGGGGGIRVPGLVFFSHRGKVVPGLASRGTHLFVAVSLGVSV